MRLGVHRGQIPGTVVLIVVIHAHRTVLFTDQPVCGVRGIRHALIANLHLRQIAHVVVVHKFGVQVVFTFPSLKKEDYLKVG